MRVLQVVTHMNRGGLETMLMNYYRQMDRSKVQFDFLVHRQYRADYDDEIEKLGGKIYRLPVLNPLSHSYKKALREFFDAHIEYRVVHVHQDCMSSVILKEAKNHGIPVRIAHSHSSSQDKNWKYLIKFVYQRKIPQYATQLLACGEEAGQWMFRGAQFQILNNAIDAFSYRFDYAKRLEMREKLGIAQTALVIGHVGRFHPSKNHEFLIDIFEAVLKKTEAVLLLIGDGNLRMNIQEKVKAKHLEAQVIFTGVRSDVNNLLQAMDVFVFPSNYEGLPVAIMEAQAAGLPCLISDKVPIECKKTDLVQQISLSSQPEIWAENVIMASKAERRDTYGEMKDSGFDIRENAKRLQEFYLKTVVGEKKICQS